MSNRAGLEGAQDLLLWVEVLPADHRFQPCLVPAPRGVLCPFEPGTERSEGWGSGAILTAKRSLISRREALR